MRSRILNLSWKRLALIAAAGYVVALHLAVVAVVAMVLVPGWKPGERSSRPHEAWFHEEVMAYHLRGDPLLPDDRIVFMGDSLIQGLPVSALTERGVNYGIGGETGEGLHTRIPRYSSLERAAAILIHTGANDLRHAADATILDRYRRILAALPDGPTVLCSAILPVDQQSRWHWIGRSADRVSALNQAIETLCDEHGGRFFSAWAELSTPDGSLRTNYHIGDGLHLSAAGNRVWIDVLRPALRAAGL